MAIAEVPPNPAASAKRSFPAASQSRTVSSLPVSKVRLPAAISLRSIEKARPRTLREGPAGRRVSAPVCRSQILTVPSAPTAASRSAGESRLTPASPLSQGRVRFSTPERASHSRSLSSRQVAASVLPSAEKATVPTSASDWMTRSPGRVCISGSLEADVEGDFRVWLSLLEELDGANQLAVSADRALVIVLVGIAFEKRIGGEVDLRNKRPMPRRGNHVVDVLRGTVRIMSRQNGLDGVFGGRFHDQLGPVPVALHVVVARVVGLPDVDPGAGNTFTTRVEHLPGDAQRETGIAGGAQDGSIRS